MDTKTIIQSVFKELFLPEFDKLKASIDKVEAVQVVTNKRLDDMNAQLIGQSRRIDQINIRIDKTNEKIDKSNSDLINRIDRGNDSLNEKIDKINSDLINRIDQTNERIDKINSDLINRIDQTNEKIAQNNDRINSLYEVVVRRDDHDKIDIRVINLERDVAVLKQKIAA